MRDVYQKYLTTVQEYRGNDKFEMPYFYVRNAFFLALFKLNEDKEPVVIVNPTQTLAKIIKDSKYILFNNRSYRGRELHHLDYKS